MSSFLKGCFLVLLVSVLAGCGGGGTNGEGNTVYITSSIKTGTSGVVSANSSGASDMNFTINSYPYSTSGSIKNSNVVINSISFAFTPVLVSSGVPPSFTPTHPSITYSGLITPGGSIDIENVPVLWDADIANILAGLGANTGTFQYNVVATFSGVETNTGKAVSTTSNFSVLIVK